jgi:hypothetical protein
MLKFGIDWIQETGKVFPQWAVTEAVLHFHVPCNAGNSLTS